MRIFPLVAEEKVILDRSDNRISAEVAARFHISEIRSPLLVLNSYRFLAGLEIIAVTATKQPTSPPPEPTVFFLPHPLPCQLLVLLLSSHWAGSSDAVLG